MYFVKGIYIGLFTIVTTIIFIYINWEEFFVSKPASFLILFSTSLFLLLWFIFSFYWGIKTEKMYKKFLLWYWGVGILHCIYLTIITLTNSPLETNFLFSIWYLCPLYGITYLLKSFHRLTLPLMLITLAFILTLLGYHLGTRVHLYKSSINKN